VNAITGLAVPYGAISLGGIDGKPLCERIAPGAFDASVKQAMAGKRNVVALVAHDWKRKIGSTRRGTLKLWTDERGVHFRLLGRKLPVGFMGMSFNFRPLRWRQDGDMLVTLLEGRLSEISICCCRVAYPQTFATVREVSC
jgi:phage head maturation protease